MKALTTMLLTLLASGSLWAEDELPLCEGDFKKWTACSYTWANGDKYVGEWRDGKYHGQGTFTWASGAKYVGGFKDDKRHGQGTFTGASGTKYVGGWKDGKRDGSVEYIDFNGHKTWEYYEEGEKITASQYFESLKEETKPQDTKDRIAEIKQLPRADLEYALIMSEIGSDTYKDQKNLLLRRISSADEYIKQLEIQVKALQKDVSNLVTAGNLLSKGNQTNKWLEFSNRILNSGTSGNNSQPRGGLSSKYSKVLTVDGAGMCPMGEGPLVKHEVAGGNRICYYR